MPTNSTPASQPSPAPTKPCPFCGNVDEVYAGGVTYCDNCGTDGPSYYRDGKPVATWNDRAEQPPPTRSDMPQECEDCGRSMTRCACCPARSDKDAELSPCPFCGAHPPHMWSLTLDGKEHSITCTECPGRAVFKSSSREQAIAAWNRRAAKAQESAPSSERCAECGLGCAPGVCIYGAANEITDVLGLFARRATAGTTAGTTAAPSGEVSFDAFWSDEVARSGGHGFGADYKHWARKGFDAARRATAGTTAAPSGEPDTETLQFLTDVVTAAGLLEHGRTCKALAKRIADAAYKMRESLFATHEMGVDAVRRAFEAYVARSGEFTDWTRLKDGYARPRVQFAWNTWLAALARRATAGPSSESIDLDKLEAVARKGFKARDSSGAIQSLAEIRDMISLARSATAGNAAPDDLTDERIQQIIGAIPYGDGWDGERWNLAIARAIEREVLSSNAGAAPGRGPRYTCIGKGGDYELIGEATGAGTARDGFKLAVYRDTEKGRLFYRTTDDFNERMAPSNQPVGAKERKEP